MAQDTPADKSQDTPDDERTPVTPANKLYANKYRSIEELEKGYWQTAQEGLRWRDQAKAQDSRIHQLEQQLNELKNTRIESEFDETGIPLKALDARIEQKALGLLQETLGPFMAASQAEISLQSELPDFPGMQELQRSLDPDVAESYRQLLNKDPQSAMKLAYSVWQAKQSVKGGELSKDQLIQETRKVDAGKAKSTRHGQGDESVAFDSKRYAEAIDYGKATNNWNPLVRMQFGDQPWYKRMVSGEDDE